MNSLTLPKVYIIVPCVLMAVFLVFELDFAKKRKEREAFVAAQLAAEKVEQEALRQQRQREAAEDTTRRNEERARREREREEAKRRDFEAMVAKAAADATAHAAIAEKLERDVAIAERELSDLRTGRDQMERDTFELAQRVERQRIERRSAEIDLQRTTQMVLARLLESPWAGGQTPPPGNARREL